MTLTFRGTILCGGGCGYPATIKARLTRPGPHGEPIGTWVYSRWMEYSDGNRNRTCFYNNYVDKDKWIPLSGNERSICGAFVGCYDVDGRDENHAFKFHIGDMVEKRWRWSKDSSSRFNGFDSMCLSKGIIHCILPHGEICISTDKNLAVSGTGVNHWHFGAYELDLISSVEEMEKETEM